RARAVAGPGPLRVASLPRLPARGRADPRGAARAEARRPASAPRTAPACGVTTRDVLGRRTARGRRGHGLLETRCRAEAALVRTGRQDLGDLVEHEDELLVGREVVRPEADAGVRPEVAEDSAPRQLLVHGLEVGHVHDDRAAPP